MKVLLNVKFKITGVIIHVPYLAILRRGAPPSPGAFGGAERTLKRPRSERCGSSAFHRECAIVA